MKNSSIELKLSLNFGMMYDVAKKIKFVKENSNRNLQKIKVERSRSNKNMSGS